MPTVSEVIDYLGRFAPLRLAADWDNVGLLLGRRNGPAERVMTCLTVTQPVIEEAVAEGVQLIVSHHPILFRGAKRLTDGDAEGKLLLPLLRADVAVYSPHTAFDNCPDGINDHLIRQFGVESASPLRQERVPDQFKLVVFVPDSDLDSVSNAVFAAGAGVIGNYTECSYRIAGTGTFFGGEGSNPTVGEAGRREEASEWRLEVVVPAAKLSAVVVAMRQAHSYEEPAYDIYPLKAESNWGEGRIGSLPTPAPLSELARLAKERLNAPGLLVHGANDKPIRTVAVACGAAGEYLTDAIRAQADLFVTGELRFHDCLRAEGAGIALLIPGHYASERPALEALATRLSQSFPDCQIWASRRETDPLRPA